MAKAIKVKMPATRHRWCRWHVLKDAKSHLGGKYSKRSKFKKQFNSLVTFETNKQAFEEGWKQLLRSYNLTKQHLFETHIQV